ncbi:MAG: ATP-binding protein [Cyclobacteriaceae bacterium]
MISNDIDAHLLRKLISKSHVGIVLTDNQGIIIWANEYILALGGYELYEVVGKKPGSIFQGKDTDQEHIRQIRTGLASGEAFETVILNYSKSGVPYWIKLQISPIYNDDHQLTHFVGTQTEVSDLKAQEEQILKFSDELEHHNQRLQNFNYIVSHNLVNQINNVNSLIRMFSKQLPEDNGGLLIQSSSRLVETVNHLRQLLRVQRGDEAWLNEEIDIGQLIKRVVSSYDHEIAEDDIEINIRCDANILIHSNPAYLESILQNLTSNAIKYRKPEVALSIDISVSKNADSVDISVSDNGRGIDLTSDRDKLFVLFSPVKATTDSLGLGLFLVKSQTTEIGGQVAVESELSVGTSFTITLPVTSDQ